MFAPISVRRIPSHQTTTIDSLLTAQICYRMYCLRVLLLDFNKLHLLLVNFNNICAFPDHHSAFRSSNTCNYVKQNCSGVHKMIRQQICDSASTDELLAPLFNSQIKDTSSVGCYSYQCTDTIATWVCRIIWQNYLKVCAYL